MASDDGHCGLGRATRHGRGPLPRLSESGPPARVTQSPNSARPRPRGRGSDLLAAATRPGGSANTASSPAPVFRRRAVRSRPGPRSASSVPAAPSPSRGARSPGPRDGPGTTHRRWEPAWHRVRPAHSAPGGHMGALPRQPGADGPGPGMRCEGAPAGTQASGPLVARGRPRRLGVGGPCRKRRTWGCDWDAAWARRPSCPV